MGQYFKIVDLTKKEYIQPNLLGGGIKLGALGHGLQGVALCRLLASPGSENPKAYGNTEKDSVYVGYWSGDKLVIPGDYDEVDGSGYNLYHKVGIDPEYKNITHHVLRWLVKDKDALGALTQLAKNNQDLLLALSRLVFEEGNNEIDDHLKQNISLNWPKLLSQKNY